MFQFIPVHQENTYALRVSGKLNHEDYLEILPQLEELLEENEKISLLIEFDDFHGMDLAALKDDFNFSRKHSKDFEKLAIVGDKKWLKWMTLLSKPFVEGSIKYFSQPDLQQAWDWLREKELSKSELDVQPLQPYKKILVGVDFSPHSKHAVKRAIQIAKPINAEVVLIHIVNENAFYDVYYGPIGMGVSLGAMSKDLVDIIDTSMNAIFTKAREQMDLLLEDLGMEQKQGVVIIGRRNTTMNSYAEAQNIDLIVMGTQGKRGMEAIMDSATRYLIGHSRCEVLAVPLLE